VTRATSSTVVVPCNTLRQPSCRSVVMPAFIASWRITPAFTRLTTISRIGSLATISSWMPVRPR
jgi:hypothetical protein